MKIVPFILILIALGCSHRNYPNKTETKEGNYTLYGKIDGIDSGKLYLGYLDTSNKSPLVIIDSTNFKNGFFIFQGKLSQPEPFKIFLKDIGGWPLTPYFILDSGITTAQLFKDSMANSFINGTRLQEQFTSFDQTMFNLDLVYHKNVLLYEKQSKNTDSLDAQYQRTKYDLLLNETEEHRGSFLPSYFVKRNLEEDWAVSQLKELYNSLDPDSYYSRYLLKLIKGKEQTLIGKQAPDFTMIDSKNRTLTNEMFKGKYLLIDFWASWCSPCREQNPNLVKAYHKFADKGLEIISVSLDKNKKDWEDAVTKDQLVWFQSCDLKGAQSKIAEDFGFLTIPTNFLIDKEGKIIDKNLSDGKIDSVLQKLF